MIEAALKQAEAYLEMDLASFPLPYGKKTPVVKWRELEATQNNIRELFAGRCNIALKCRESNIVVVDYDKKEGWEYGKETCAETGVVVQTGSGKEQHYYTNNGVINQSLMNYRGLGIDVIVNGYVVAPPSVHPCGGVYRFKLLETMTQFNPDWFPREEYKQVSLVDGTEPEDELVLRAQRFAATKPATEGNRDNTAFVVACFFVQALGMRPELALEQLRAWNNFMCRPPLSPSKIRWKIQEAARLKKKSEPLTLW